jgi:hypothetical protein
MASLVGRGEEDPVQHWRSSDSVPPSASALILVKAGISELFFKHQPYLFLLKLLYQLLY